MRVFITGASGWIGTPTTGQLVAAGHQVTGLARSDASAAALASLGARAVRGDIDDLDVLRSCAADADAVIHLAFRHDIAFSGGFAEATRSDRRAVEAMGEVLGGSGGALFIASGLAGLPGVAPGTGRPLTERDGHGGPVDDPTDRHATAEYVLGLAGHGVRSVVVRLAPTNHGDGDHGFIARLVAIARATGLAGYPEAANRWAAVSRADTARLFALALEKAPAGSTLHAVAEEAVPMRDIQGAIGARLGLPVAAVPASELDAHFGLFAPFATADMTGSSVLTQELLGWHPEGPGLLDDIAAGYYTRD